MVPGTRPVLNTPASWDKQMMGWPRVGLPDKTQLHLNFRFTVNNCFRVSISVLYLCFHLLTLRPSAGGMLLKLRFQARE